MGLALSAVRHANAQFDNPVVTPLPQGRFTIGRGDDANITLEDPSRRISRVHAIVEGQGDRYFLSVASRVNPVHVNGDQLQVGQSRPLAAGDEIVIGDYVFKVVGGGAAAPAAHLPPDPFATGGSGSGQPLDDILGVLPSHAPPAARSSAMDNLLGAPPGAPSAGGFDQLLGALGGAPTAAPALGPSGLPGFGAAPSAGAPPGSLEVLFGQTMIRGLDSILGAGNTPAVSDPLGLNRGARVNAGTGFSDGGRGIDHVQPINLPFNPPPAAYPPPLAAPPPPPATRSAPIASPTKGLDALGILGPIAPEDDNAFKKTDPVGLFGQGVDLEVDPADPLALFGAPPVKPGEVDFVLDEHPASVPDPQPLAARPGMPSMPSMPNPAQGPSTAPSSAAGAMAGASSSGVLAAAAMFLQGAGITHVKLNEAQAQQLLEESGALCRAAVEGVIGLLLARATMREELRATERTMLAANENNPLKMMESTEEAIDFVFNPGQRSAGFLAPPQAVSQACKELQAHEIAVIAGMRSAIMGSLKRFEPDALEKRFELASKGKVALLANKKALLWDFFVQFQAKTTEDANDNFDRVFGSDFLRAYMQQIEKLK